MIRFPKLILGILLLIILMGCQFEDILKEIPLLGDVYRLPDVDQKFTEKPIINILITHRSILTHNAVFPLLVAWLCRSLKSLGVIVSLIIGSIFAFHFLLDLFPKKWYGYAFIHIPVLGWLDWIPYDNNWLPTVFSIGWLSLNMLLSLFSFAVVLRFSKKDTTG